MATFCFRDGEGQPLVTQPISVEPLTSRIFVPPASQQLDEVEKRSNCHSYINMMKHVRTTNEKATLFQGNRAIPQ